MEEEDEDSDASVRLVIDYSRIHETDPDEPTKARRRKPNASDTQTYVNTSNRTNTKENIPELFSEQRTVENKTPVINYAAIMNKEHIKNIPFDILNYSNNKNDVNDSFGTASEQGKHKESIVTCDDISLIPHDNLNEIREDSALYACLIENNMSNLTKYLNRSVNSIPINAYGIEENNTTLCNARLIDLLNKPAVNLPTGYRKTNGPSDLAMHSNEIQNPRNETISSVATKVCNRNIATTAQDAIHVETNGRIASVIVPIGTSGAIHRTEASANAHKPDRSNDISIPSGHRPDRNNDNGIPVMYGHSYQTPTVNDHQNQEIYLNHHSRLHSNSAAPPALSRQNVMMHQYSQAYRHMGPHAPINARYPGPGYPTNMGPPRPPLPNPQMPVMPSNKCPYPNCSQTTAPVNPAQTMMMAWNNYASAYNSNASMPQYPRGLNPNISATQQLVAMNRNSYTHAIQDRQLSVFNSHPSMNPKPKAQPKRKAADRKPAPSKVAKTKAPLNTKDHLQSTNMHIGIETRLPNLKPPAYTLRNNIDGSQGQLRTNANFLPTRMNMNIETAQTTTRTAGYNMYNITSTHAPINPRINIHTTQANVRTPAYNATDALLKVNLQTKSMNYCMESAQIDLTTNNITHATNTTQTNNGQTTSMGMNTDTFGVSVRSAEFNMSKVTNHLQTTVNTDNNVILDMTMKKTQTGLKSVYNTNDLTLNTTQHTGLPVTKINSIVTPTTDIKTINCNMNGPFIEVLAPFSIQNHSQAETDTGIKTAQTIITTNDILNNKITEANVTANRMGINIAAQADGGSVTNRSHNSYGTEATFSSNSHSQSPNVCAELAQVHLRSEAHDISYNTSNLQATSNAADLQPSTMNSSVKSAQAALKPESHDLSSDTNKLQATLKTEVHLGSPEMDMSIESTQVDLRTAAHDLSDDKNNLLATLKTEVPLGSPEMDYSAAPAQADPRVAARDLNDKANNLQITFKTEAPLNTPEMDMNIESAQADLRTVAHDLSNDTNNLLATLKTEAPLEAPEMNMSIESPQPDLRTAAHQLSNNTNSLQDSLNTGEHLQSEKVPLMEKSEADIVLSNIKTEIPSPSNTPADLIQKEIDVQGEQVQVRTPDDDVNNGIDRIESPLDNEAYLQLIDIDGIQTAVNDKCALTTKIINTCNSIKVLKNTKARWQKIETKTSIARTQADINMVALGKSSTANRVEVSLGVSDNLRSEAISINNNKTHSDLRVNASTQQVKTSTEISAVAPKNTKSAKTIIDTTDKIHNPPNDKVYSQKTELNMNNNITQVNIHMQSNETQAINDMNIERDQIQMDTLDISHTPNKIEVPLSSKGNLRPETINISNNKTQPDSRVNANTKQVKASMDISPKVPLVVSKNTKSTKTVVGADKIRNPPNNNVNTQQTDLNKNKNQKQVDMQMQSKEATNVANSERDQIQILAVGMSHTPDNKGVQININDNLQLESINISNNKTKPELRVNARTKDVKTTMNIGPKVPTVAPKNTKLTETIIGADKIRNPPNNKVNTQQIDLNINEYQKQVDMQMQIKKQEATNVANSEREKIPMKPNARIKQATTKAKMSTTSITTETITQAILSNEFTQSNQSIVSNTSNDNEVCTEAQVANSTFNIFNQRVEKIVTVEVINRISIQTDVLKAIIDNVQRNSEVQDRNIAPMITDAQINESAENRFTLGHNRHELMTVNNKDEDEKLKAARKRLALISAIQTERKEIRNRDSVVNKQGSHVEQTDCNTTNSKDSGQIHNEVQTKSYKAALKTNNHTEDCYDSQKVTSKRFFEKNQVDEATRDTAEGGANRYKQYEDKADPNNHLYSRRTPSINIADIQQASRIQEELIIDETLFFIFQIQFFRRVQERLRDNNHKKMAKKLKNTIHKLIAISDNEGAKADLKYKCHKCLQKLIYSPRQLYFQLDMSYVENVTKTIQNCQICLLFMSKYIEVLKKYVETCNGNADTETDRNSDGQIEGPTNSTNDYQNRKIDSHDNLSFNSIHEYLHVDTEPVSLFCNQEGEFAKVANEQNPDCDSIEEQLSIISGEPINPAELDNKEEQNMENVLDVCGNPDTGNKTSNVVVKLPHIKLKESTIEKLINNKNIESAETTSNVTNIDTDNNERESYDLRRCLSNEIENTENLEPNISESKSSFNDNNEKQHVDLLKSIIIQTAATIVSKECNKNRNTQTDDNNDGQNKGEHEHKTCVDPTPRKRKISTAATNDNPKTESIKRHCVVMKNNSIEADVGTNAKLDSINVSTSSNNENVNINNKDRRDKIEENSSTDNADKMIVNDDNNKTDECCKIKRSNSTANVVKTNESTKDANQNKSHKRKEKITSSKTVAIRDNCGSIKKHSKGESKKSTDPPRSTITEPRNESISITQNKDNDKDKKHEKIKKKSIETTGSLKPHKKDMNTKDKANVGISNNIDNYNNAGKTIKADSGTAKTAETHKNNIKTTIPDNDTKQKKKEGDHGTEKTISNKAKYSRDTNTNDKERHRQLRKSISSETSTSPVIESSNENIGDAATINVGVEPHQENLNTASNNNEVNHQELRKIGDGNVTTKDADAKSSKAGNNNHINKSVKKRHGVSKKCISSETASNAIAQQPYNNVDIATNVIPAAIDDSSHSKNRHRELRKSMSTETVASAIAVPRNESTSIASNKYQDKEEKQEKRNRMSMDTAGNDIISISTNIHKTTEKNKEKRSIETVTTTNAEAHIRNMNTASKNNKGHKNTIKQYGIMKSLAAGTATSKNAELTSVTNNEKNNNKEKERHGVSRKRRSSETVTSTVADHQRNINSNEDEKKKCEKRKRQSIESTITTNAEPRPRNVNTPPNNNNNDINIARSTNKKHENNKRKSDESVTTTNTETQNLKSSNNNENNSESHCDIRKNVSCENADTHGNTAAKNGNDNGKNKNVDHQRAKFTKEKTASSKNTAPTHALNNISNKRRHSEGRKSICTDITTNTSGDPRNKNSENSDSKTDKKREKIKRTSVKSTAPTNVDSDNLASQNSINNENTSGKQHGRRKSVTDVNASNKNGESRRKTNKHTANDKDNPKYKESHHRLEKINIVETAIRKNAEPNTTKQDDINIKDKRRQDEARKGSSADNTSNKVEDSENRRTNVAKTTDNKKEKKHEKRKRMSIETTTILEPHDRNIDAGSHKKKKDKENNCECQPKKIKRITSETANTENEKVSIIQAPAKDDKDNQKKEKIWTLYSVECNPSRIPKILIKAQNSNKGHHEPNDTESDATTNEERIKNIKSASNNNDEGKRAKEKNKERHRVMRRSCSNKTVDNTSANKPGQDKISASNKSNLDKSRAIEITKGTPPITSKTTSNRVNTGINSKNTSANQSADVGKPKFTEPSSKNNEEQTNEDSDSSDSDSDTDEDSDLEENESDDEANRTVNKALDNASKLLKDNCTTKDLPAVKIPGTSTRKKENKNRITDTPYEYQYECVCTAIFTYLQSLFTHALRYHKVQNPESIKYTISRKCPFCVIPNYIPMIRNKYNKHVKMFHPDKFTEIFSDS